MLKKARNSISDGTFTNYFKKSEISEKSMKALNDKDYPFASLDVEEHLMESLKDETQPAFKDVVKTTVICDCLSNNKLSVIKYFFQTL